MVVVLPQFADKALQDLVVDAFKHPGVVGIEETDPFSSLLGERTGA